MFNFLTALTAVVGAIIALVVGSAIEGFVSLLIPFATGNSIYIAGSDLIPELRKDTSESEESRIADGVSYSRRYPNVFAAADRVSWAPTIKALEKNSSTFRSFLNYFCSNGFCIFLNLEQFFCGGFSSDIAHSTFRAVF